MDALSASLVAGLRIIAYYTLMLNAYRDMRTMMIDDRLTSMALGGAIVGLFAAHRSLLEAGVMLVLYVLVSILGSKLGVSSADSRAIAVYMLIMTLIYSSIIAGVYYIIVMLFMMMLAQPSTMDEKEAFFPFMLFGFAITDVLNMFIHNLSV